MSNISAPMSNIKNKDFKFHKYFSTNFPQYEPNSDKKTRRGLISGSYELSSVKQKQIQEFNTNLKEGRIKKYGLDAESSPLVSKNLTYKYDILARSEAK